MTWWWTCPLCFDRMERREEPDPVTYDRDDHLWNSHGIKHDADSPYRTNLSFWWKESE